MQGRNFMPGSCLEGFVRSLGLETEDVPKVVGAFVCCKYLTWGAGIAVGVRYHPLRRLVLARSAIREAEPWAQRQRARLFEALERARRSPPLPRLTPAPSQRAHSLDSLPLSRAPSTAVNATSETSVRVGGYGRPRRYGAAPGDIKRRTFFHWREAMHHAITNGWYRRAGLKILRVKKLAQRHQKMRRKQFAQLQATYRDITAEWRKRATLKLLRFQKMVQRQRRHFRQKNPWYAWVSVKYWKCSDKLTKLVKTSPAGQFFSTNLGLKPQGLALGFAEGTLLFKVCSPFVLPLQLWLLVNFFKRQRLQGFLAKAPASCDDGVKEDRLASV